MARKRRLSLATGNGWTAPPEKRLRADGGIPEPAGPPSPRWWLLRRTVFVVLFLIRAKDRSMEMGNMSFSLVQIGRVVREQIRHCFGPFFSKLESMDGKLESMDGKLESMDGQIRALTQKMDNITCNSRSGQNHERHIRQGTNQEGTNNAAAQGSAETETNGTEARIRLRFCSEMKPPVYHDEERKSIRIGIFDGDTKIKSGPYSELKIEVLALEGSFPYDAQGSWTSKEFHEHKAYGRDGKGNVLVGKGTNAQLINGECELGSIRFKEGSCRARNGKFIVGARVCDGQAICGRVQEAVMNPVVVRDHRNKYNEKIHPPNPDHEVYRLENISTTGKYRERLEEEGIRTVGQFLKALYKDEDNLARILQIKKKCKDWDKMVNHAQECCLQGKPGLKSYRCDEENVVLFFNYVHRLVGARFSGRYITSDMFKPAEKILVEKLKKNAYDQLDGLTEDHVMGDNTPVPLCMNTDGGAGPSYMTSATQQNNSGHHIAAHQGTLTSEVLSPRAPPEPLLENANNDHGPNSIPDPNSTHNDQVGGVPPVESLRHGPNESPFATANSGPSSSFSVPDHPTTQNHQDQGTGLADMEQHAVFDDIFPGPLDYGQAFSVASDMHLLTHEEADELLFLPHQADTNIWEALGLHQGGMQSPAGWSGINTSEASASAPICIVPMPQLLNNTGPPGSGQWSMQNQTQASLPNNDGTTGSSSGAAQQPIPPHQRSQYQGNMPGDTSF